MSNNLLDNAIFYAEKNGWAVLPLWWITDAFTCACPKGKSCSSPGKHPLTKTGLKEASIDLAVIENWWANWPEANIGIATGAISGLIVLDVDLKNGGLATVMTLPQIAATLVANTGGGGLHYLFTHPGQNLRNTAGKLGAGIDTRGDGGYIVAAPSRHISGDYYEWATDTGQDLADCPDWLLQMWQAPSVNHTNGAGPAVAQNTPTAPPLVASAPAQIPDTIASGSRNQTLVKLAGWMRNKGFSQEAMLGALTAENNRLCQPPLPDAEVRDIARKVSQKYQAGQDFSQFMAMDDFAGPGKAFSDLAKPLGTFLTEKTEPGEIIAAQLRRGEIGLLASFANHGKSTITRNLALSLSSGRDFLSLAPVAPSGAPRRTLFIDFESSERLREDLRLMVQQLTTQEQTLAGQYFRVIAEAEWNNELFSLSSHLTLLDGYLTQNPIDLLVVDTLGAGFNLDDENHNAELARGAMKPLLLLARKHRCAVLIIHHVGKPKDEHAKLTIHNVRGGSVLAGYPAAVWLLQRDEKDHARVTLQCAKHKGGANYAMELELNQDTRWFGLAVALKPPKPKTNYEQVIEYLKGQIVKVKKQDIVKNFMGKIPEVSLERYLRDGIAQGDLEMPKRGFYRALFEDDLD